MSTFLFLLGVNRIDSHVSTKVEKKDGALLSLSHIFAISDKSINDDYAIITWHLESISKRVSHFTLICSFVPNPNVLCYDDDACIYT
jgi:hypothetical protein